MKHLTTITLWNPFIGCNLVPDSTDFINLTENYFRDLSSEHKKKTLLKCLPWNVSIEGLISLLNESSMLQWPRFSQGLLFSYSAFSYGLACTALALCACIIALLALASIAPPQSWEQSTRVAGLHDREVLMCQNTTCFPSRCLKLLLTWTMPFFESCFFSSL